MYLSVCLPARPSIHSSITTPTYLPTYPPTHPPTLPTHLPTTHYLPTYLPKKQHISQVLGNHNGQNLNYYYFQSYNFLRKNDQYKENDLVFWCDV